MKFKLEVVGPFYKKGSQYHKELESLGFKFRDYEDKEVMVDDDHEPILYLNTLQDLMRFIDKWGTVIVNNDTVRIYNDYNE